MEIVTGDPAPRQEPEVVRDTLLELAAVVRTIFGAPAPVAQAQDLAPAAAPAALDPEPMSLGVPDLPQPPAAPHGQHSTVAAAAPAAIPVPAIAVPDLPSPPEVAESTTEPTDDPHDDPQAERHSLALLQEIAFLDD